MRDLGREPEVREDQGSSTLSITRLELLLEPLGEPNSSKGRSVRRALARQPAQNSLHRLRNAHIELGCVVLK